MRGMCVGQIFGDASIDQMRILSNFDHKIEVLHGDFGGVLEISEHEDATVGAQTHTMRTRREQKCEISRQRHQECIACRTQRLPA